MIRFLLWAILLSFLVGILVVADGFLIEPHLLRTAKVEVAIPGLPHNLEGFVIGVLSDLHIGLVPAERIRRAASALSRLEADLVVVVGDYAGGEDDDSSFSRKNPDPQKAKAAVEYALEPVTGAVGVLGNWDNWYWGLSGRERELKCLRMLVNSGFEAAPGLWVCGVDDVLTGRPDAAEALRGAPQGSVKILLAHEPDYADEIDPGNGIALQISGHSHGGQVRLPGLGAIFLPPMGAKYVSGLYHTSSGHQVYTNSGLGMSHIPARFLCPPEITLITLTRTG